MNLLNVSLPLFVWMAQTPAPPPPTTPEPTPAPEKTAPRRAGDPYHAYQEGLYEEALQKCAVQ